MNYKTKIINYRISIFFMIKKKHKSGFELKFIIK